MTTATQKYRYQELVEQLIADYCLRLAPGALLPGMAELCGRYSTSEITIKRSMALLAKHGFVKRIPGKGTMVLESPRRAGVRGGVYIPQHKIRVLLLESWNFSTYLEEQARRYAGLNPEVEFQFDVRRRMEPGDTDGHDLVAANEWEWALADETRFRPLESLHGLHFSPSSFFPEVLAGCRRGGETYLLPLGFSPLIAVYNLDRPEGAKFDWTRLDTFDRFAEAMRAARGPELKYPFFCLAVNPSVWTHFVRGFGGDLWDAERRVCLLDRPEAVRGLSVMHDWLHRDRLSPVLIDYTFGDLFGTGRFWATWGRYSLLQRTGRLRLGMAPPPQGETPANSLFLEGLLVSRAARRLGPIRDFLNFLLGADAQLELCARTDGICSQKALAHHYTTAVRRDVAGLDRLPEALEGVRLTPENADTARMLRSLRLPLQLLALGIYTPAEGGAELARAAERNDTDHSPQP